MGLADKATLGKSFNSLLIASKNSSALKSSQLITTSICSDAIEKNYLNIDFFKVSKRCITNLTRYILSTKLYKLYKGLKLYQ